MPRKWYQFWMGDESSTQPAALPPSHDPVSETESLSYTPNMSVEYSTIVFGDGCPYKLEEIRAFTKDPMRHIREIRRLSEWAYYNNGVVSSAIDYMRGIHTLDGVIVCKGTRAKGKQPANFERNKTKMKATLNTIRYKQFLRDGIFKDAKDGMYVGYFELTEGTQDLKGVLTDYEVANITEINELGVNCTITPLPIDYVKIVGRRNNSYVIAFDLTYFNKFADEEARKKILNGFPKEIRDGYVRWSVGNLKGNWLVLDNDKTIVTKIKAEISDPYGVPFPVAALDDIVYQKFFIDTKRNVLDSVNNQIVYETFPEGKDKGTSALTGKQQEAQHNIVKAAIQNKVRNRANTSFFSLAAGTKMDKITLDTEVLDEKNENSIKNAVNKGIGVAASALDGSSTGNYASSNLNLELVAANVYTWIEDLVDELNKVINKNIVKDPSCPVSLWVMPITMVNKDKMVGYASDLYSRGKGSLYYWIASTGVDPDNYLSLMDYELTQDFENHYPVHRTSFTITGKDAPDEDHNQGGRPSTDSDNPQAVQQKTNGGNTTPKPSTS